MWQLDKIVKYLSDFIDSCDTVSLEVNIMVSSDRIKYILNVMLSEVGQQLFVLHLGIYFNEWQYSYYLTVTLREASTVKVLTQKMCTLVWRWNITNVNL